MVKAYLRYEQSACGGVVASQRGGVAWAPRSGGQQLACAALEAVSVRSVRTGAQAAALLQEGNSSGVGGQERLPEVTSLLSLPSGLLAAGYADGHTRLWEFAASGEAGGCRAQLRGHRRAVGALACSVGGGTLATGGHEGDVVLWDAVADSGLCRLKGHRGAITAIVFLQAQGAQGAQAAWLASASKDGMVRVWHAPTRHCVQVLQAWRGECWALALRPDGKRLVAGCGDEYLRLFDVDVAAGESLTAAAADADAARAGAEKEGAGEEEGAEKYLGGAAGSLVDKAAAAQCAVLRDAARLKRSIAAQSSRVHSLAFSGDAQLLAVAAAGKFVEIYRCVDAVGAAKRAKRRARRQKEKAAKKKAAQGVDAEGDVNAEGDAEAAAPAEEAPAVSDEVTAADELQLQETVATKARTAGIAFAPPDGAWAPRGAAKGAVQRLAIALSNNSVQVLHVTQPKSKDADGVELKHTLEVAGHRADVRAVAISADDKLLVSASSNQLKVWSTDAPSGAAPLATAPCGYALSCLVAPGGRFAVVGTKTGVLQVFDLGAAVMVDEVAAHKAEVWGLAALPDGSGLVSGGADRQVRFWEYAVAQADEKNGGAASITLRETRAMAMSDDVLGVCFGGAESKYLAVSLLDSTVKVFFADSLKFFLSLYGHKLPVMCMDGSDDGALLATGGADKNVRLWGLDFGDCHRSLFAHDGSVMSVAFVPKTHYLFSAGKDGAVKYWDADKFELLLTLEGHHSQIWAMAISSRGDFVVSGGADRSIRRWARTDEPFFIEEERERKLDSLFEAEGAGGGGEGAVTEGALAPAANPEMDASLAGRRTMETADAADRLIEALDMASTEQKRRNEAAGGADDGSGPNPLLLGLGPDAYVLRTVRGVRSAELEQALLVLPFEHAVRLLAFLARQLARGGADVELCVRCATTVARLHHDQLSGAQVARETLGALQAACRPAAEGLRGAMGYNLAALRIMQQRIESDKLGLLSAAEERVATLRAASAKLAATAAGGGTLGVKAGQRGGKKAAAGKRTKKRRLA